MLGILEFEQATQRAEMLVLVVEFGRILLELGVAVLAHGLLQQADRGRVDEVILAVLAELVLPADDQLGLGVAQRLIGVPVLDLRLARQHVEPDAFDPRGCAREVGVDQFLVQADGLKDLCAAIALQGRDAHLREGLQQALVDGLDVVVLGLFFGQRGGQQVAPLQIVDGFNREIRIDGAGTVADQQGKVHHLARLAAFNDDGDLRAGLFLDEAIVHGGHRQQAWDRRIGRVNAAIRENQQRVAGVHGERGAVAQIVERVAQALFAVLGAEQRGQRGGQQVARGDAAQLFQIPVRQDRLHHLERVAVLRRLGQNVALGADVADQRHHHLFTDRVDRRIGDLREQLLEVVEERLRTIRQAGQRHVGAHRTQRLHALGGHRSKQNLEVLFAIARGALATQQRLRVRGDHPRRLRQLLHRDLLLFEPLAVGLAAGELMLDLVVGDDALLDGVDQEHAARLQAALFANVLGGNLDDAGL